MNLAYLIQLTTIWLVCYLFYYTWLRSERLPAANRFFLLVSLFAGPLIPLLPTLEWVSFSSSEIVRQFTAQLETITVVAVSPEGFTAEEWGTRINWWLRLWSIGAAIALLRLIRGWWQLYKVYTDGTSQMHPDGYRIVRLKRGGSPFSYCNTLFWPADMDINAAEWQSVRAHEQAHIEQRHTYDLILVDLLSIIFWWNPLPYLYRSSLKLQHEYLADEAATNLQQANVRDYARLLLQHQLVGWVPRPGHAFHHSHIKNRIIMLTKPKGANWKLLATLPLFIALFWACNQDSADITGVNIAETEAMMAAQRDQQPKDHITETLNGEIVYKVVEQMPIYGDCAAELAMGDIKEAQNCGNAKLLTDIYENITYPAVARDRGAEGMVVISFVVPASGGEAVDFKLVRSASSGKILTADNGNDVTVVGHDNDKPLLIASEKEAYDAIDAEAMKTAMNLPQNWTAGMQGGESVAVRFNLPVKFKLE